MENKKTRWELYKEKNGVTPLDALNPKTKKSDPVTATQRYDTCKFCEHFLKMTNQCKKCGCFMNVKVGLENAQCPVGHW